MVFLEAVEDGSHVLLLQELLLLDMDGIDQIRLTVLLRDAGFRDFNHGFLAVAPEAEEEILLKSSEEQATMFTWRYWQMQCAVCFLGFERGTSRNCEETCEIR